MARASISGPFKATGGFEVGAGDSSGTNTVVIESGGGLRTQNVDGQIIPLCFAQVNAGASQSAVALNALGSSDNTEYVMPRAGSIVGISVGSNAARTAGTLTLEPTIDGTVKTPTAVLDATNTQYHQATQNKDTASQTFTAGQRIGVKVTTTAAWAPTTADILVTVFVEI